MIPSTPAKIKTDATTICSQRGMQFHTSRKFEPVERGSGGTISLACLVFMSSGARSTGESAPENKKEQSSQW
jgi:hypothetical protein